MIGLSETGAITTAQVDTARPVPTTDKTHSGARVVQVVRGSPRKLDQIPTIPSSAIESLETTHASRDVAHAVSELPFARFPVDDFERIRRIWAYEPENDERLVHLERAMSREAENLRNEIRTEFGSLGTQLQQMIVATRNLERERQEQHGELSQSVSQGTSTHHTGTLREERTNPYGEGTSAQDKRVNRRPTPR